MPVNEAAQLVASVVEAGVTYAADGPPPRRSRFLRMLYWVVAITMLALLIWGIYFLLS